MLLAAGAVALGAGCGSSSEPVVGDPWPEDVRETFVTACTTEADSGLATLGDTISAEGIEQFRTGFATICQDTLTCLEATATANDVADDTPAGTAALASCREGMTEAALALGAEVAATYPS